MHLQQARESAIDHAPVEPSRAGPAGEGWSPLAQTAAFGLRSARVQGSLDLAPAGAFALLTALSGQGTLAAGGQRIPLRPGATALLAGPGRLSGTDLSVLCTDAPA